MQDRQAMFDQIEAHLSDAKRLIYSEVDCTRPEFLALECLFGAVCEVFALVQAQSAEIAKLKQQIQQFEETA